MPGAAGLSALLKGGGLGAGSIAEFDASIANIERETGKALTKELRRVGNEVRDVVRGRTVPPFKTGALRKSIKTSVRGKGVVSLHSNLPYAPLWDYGGTIQPRGVPIEFKATMFVTGTVLGRGDDIDEKLADAFDSISHRNGWL